jgi:beta-lactam-binding protein with PASTA domain
VGSGLVGSKVQAAKRVLTAAHCGIGTIRFARSDLGVPKGRVSAQKPQFGAVLPGGAKVDLVVSRGSK